MAVGVTNIDLQSHPINGFVFLLLSKKLIKLKFYHTGLPVGIMLQTPIPLVVQAEEDEMQERIPAGSAVGPLFFLLRCSYCSPPFRILP